MAAANMADKRQRVMLNNLLKNGELYAAHQKYRTSAARLLKTPAPSAFGTGKSSASSGGTLLEYDDAAKQAAELLYEGARALLERGELGGGTDLSLYLLDTWSSRHVPCSDENRNKIQTLIFLVSGKGKWRKPIVDHATAWSCSDEAPAGDPALHAYIGQVLYKDRDFYGAEQHFLAAQTRDTARSLATLLFDWYKVDPSSSASASISTLGRYAARGVLSYLEASSILCASIFIESFLSLVLAADPNLLAERIPLTKWADDSALDPEIVVTKIASLNFLQLVLKTCQVGLVEQQVKKPGNQPGTQTSYPGKAAWMQLVHRYEREVPWLKEPEVKESTNILAEMYFDIKPANAGGANILGDLMSSLFGGGSSAAPTAGAGRGRGRGRIAAAAQVAQPGLD